MSKASNKKFDMFKFIVWTGVGVSVSVSVFIGGLLAKGFHWLA